MASEPLSGSLFWTYLPPGSSRPVVLGDPLRQLDPLSIMIAGFLSAIDTGCVSAIMPKLDAGFLARRPFGDCDRDLAMSPKLESEDRLS